MTTHQKTRDSYNKKAKLYFQEEGNETPLTDVSLVKEMIPKIKGLTVLSIGCGAGKELSSFSRRGAASILAVEPSEFLRSKAKENCPKANVFDGDIENLPFANASVDFAYCGHVLHYLKDWEVALKEVQRVLKPSAKLLVTLHHPLDWGFEVSKEKGRSVGYSIEGEQIGNYLKTREVSATWFGQFDIVYYPRSIATSLNEFLQVGFRLCELQEGAMNENSDLPLFFAMLFERI